MKDYDLVVATTSVNRPDLHSVVFPNYFDLLDELDCYWFVNVDCIAGGCSLEETIDNYKNMFDKHSNIEYEFSSINLNAKTTITDEDMKTNPHVPRYGEDTGLAGTYEGWYKSCQYIWTQSIKPSSKYGVFWLEDDWGVPKEPSVLETTGATGLITPIHTKLKDIFEITGFGDMDYIPLTAHTGVTSQPGVFGPGLVENYILPHLNDKTNDRWMRSPERAVTRYPMPSRNIYAQYAYFYEIGRDWAEKNISKFKRISEDAVRTFNTQDYYKTS